jgi:hypothetical protein
VRRLPGVGQRNAAPRDQIRSTGLRGDWIVPAGRTQAMQGDLTGGLGQMEPAFEPLHGIGLFALLPAVVMAETAGP